MTISIENTHGVVENQTSVRASGLLSANELYIISSVELDFVY